MLAERTCTSWRFIDNRHFSALKFTLIAAWDDNSVDTAILSQLYGVQFYTSLIEGQERRALDVSVFNKFATGELDLSEDEDDIESEDDG